jgi:hypothetical protein
MTSATSRPSSSTRSGTPWAVGASTFAACIMLMAGVFQAIQGIAALVNGTDFLNRTENYVVTFTASVWGWIHLILGILIAAAGGFILTGNVAARAAGIALAVLSAIANFLWLPYYPIWAIIIIALNVFIIWGLAKADLGKM